ncbi:MAG: PHP domain-containing protein [Bacilli bacterium]|jgi:predicted metal-dependent phosphoesterase TrpH|nr:PHP domain-containing protein [Bacilli bacterium]MDY0064067.1 PHP domain-containing protein [Bacilli bacterium]
MKADLHTHTTYSDGKLQVDELIQLAVSHHLDYLSITDHDTFEGVKLAKKTKEPITVIYGMELSTYHKKESIHVLSYFKEDTFTATLQPILDHQIHNRKGRAYKMLEKLKEIFAIDLNPAFIEQLKSVTRGSIAKEIVKQGFASSTKEVFARMIGDDCPAYIPSSKLSTQEGIQLVKQAKGLAVLAHPMNLKVNRLDEILQFPFDGVEGIYPNHTDKKAYYRDIAKQYNLFLTGGTDFHTFDDGKHGNLGDTYLADEDVEIFLKRLYEC